MRIGLIDVDGHNFPNLPLMKLSAWHKRNGDEVEWYNPLLSGHMDKVYMSKVFSFSDDYQWPIDADEIIRGGTGYAIETIDGKEVYRPERDIILPAEVEHICPDYSLYPQFEDTAYGFMTRGCPRGCNFCIVGDKEGRKTQTVAPLEEFWRGQKNVVLLDPSPIAAMEWKENLQQLIDSKATVDFTQGVDIRLMTEERAEYLKRVKTKAIHFAWDRYEDKDIIVPRLRMYKEITGCNKRRAIVYILVGYNTTLQQDLERIYTVRELGFNPDVRVYEKYSLPKGHILLKLQRYVNNRIIFNSIKRFEEYDKLTDNQRELVLGMGVG